jgi:hypothetical protein
MRLKQLSDEFRDLSLKLDKERLEYSSDDLTLIQYKKRLEALEKLIQSFRYPEKGDFSN